VAARGTWRGESQFRHFVSGEAIATEQVSFPIADPSGSVRAYGIVSRDIRARLVRSEQAARREAEAARQALENVLERVSDGFVALDTSWRYNYVNARGAAMLGRQREDLLGKHIWTEFPDGIGQPFHLAYERAFAEQVPVHLEQHYPPW